MQQQERTRVQTADEQRERLSDVIICGLSIQNNETKHTVCEHCDTLAVTTLLMRCVCFSFII